MGQSANRPAYASRMNTHDPIPLDKALDPDGYFGTEAQHWWNEELEAYGSNRLYGFEVHGAAPGTQAPDSPRSHPTTEAPFDA